MSLGVLDLLQLTYRSLSSNRLRASLTMFGVFMGVAAVNATLQVGNISRAIIAQRLAERQAPQVTLFPMWMPNSPWLSLHQEDLTYLNQRLTNLQASSALDWGDYPQVIFRDKTATPELTAVSEDFLLTSGQTLLAGRFFNAADFANYRPVVVINQFLADELFGQQNPIGQRIYFNRQSYIVLGVLPTAVNEYGPPEGQILVSLAFHNALRGQERIGRINLRPQRIEDLADLAEQAQQLLAQRYPGRQFHTWNNVEDILEQQQVLQLAANALAAVGAISLLVGGVGIANIMIASVTERTSEIGLRRAIGATQREILLQFILEASLLSLMGGVAAVITVHGLTLMVTEQFDLPYQFDTHTTAIALGSALGVGIGASLLPAIRASQLDPVKALRSE